LLKYGANVDLKDIDGKTARDYANGTHMNDLLTKKNSE